MVLPKRLKQYLQPRVEMMKVATMGPALQATFIDVDITLQQVPNSVGENHCKIETLESYKELHLGC